MSEEPFPILARIDRAVSAAAERGEKTTCIRMSRDVFFPMLAEFVRDRKHSPYPIMLPCAKRQDAGEWVGIELQTPHGFVLAHLELGLGKNTILLDLARITEA